jgi:8-amino-3,8-dideoxy-alpha-D-manno-octulosonate transaminase
MAVNETLAIHGGRKAIEQAIPSVGFGAELIGEEEERNVLRAMRERILCRMTNTFADSWVARCEEDLMRLAKTPYFYATNSCATGLHLAAVALGVGPGDVVLVSGCGWFSTAAAVINAGAVPVPVEFGEDLTIDCDDLQHKLETVPHVKALMLVHWRGLPANMDRVMELTKKHNILLIEDCAQCFGGTYKGQFLGTFGDVGCYSFNMHKVITCGEGGGLAVKDAAIYRRAVQYGGFYSFYRHFAPDGGMQSMPPAPMTNYRMPEMCGAMLHAQIGKLDTVLSTMRARRDELVAGLMEIPQLRLANRHDPKGDCGYTIPLVFETAEKARFFMDAMKAEGALVSNANHAFGGGEARGTAALVQSEGLPLTDTGPMAVANTWRCMVEKNGPTKNFRPWDWLSNPVDLPLLVPKTTERLARVVAFKTNTKMTAEHTAATLVAARKVAAAL